MWFKQGFKIGLFFSAIAFCFSLALSLHSLSEDHCYPNDNSLEASIQAAFVAAVSDAMRVFMQPNRS